MRLNLRTRLYRIDTGPIGDSLTQRYLFSSLGGKHKGASRYYTSPTPGWRHYFTTSGWEKFGKPAYNWMRSAKLKPHLEHARHGVHLGQYEALVWRGGSGCSVMAHTRGGRPVRAFTRSCPRKR